MSGTKAGGRRAAATNKRIYGKDFYALIGKEGGKRGHTGGFFANRELASRAGAIGGRKSKRRPTGSGVQAAVKKVGSSPVKRTGKE